MKIDQELIKRNSPIEDYASHTVHHRAEKIDDNQENERKQLCQSSIVELQPPSLPLPTKPRSHNLTEIDENDFFYQGPSPYVTVIENNQMPDKFEQSSTSSYKIDEYIDEDDNDERDHVKELEETIANLSRHFPVLSQQLNDIEIKPIVTNLHQPSTLSVGKIDIDSILEMEIESPSTDEHYIQSSSSVRPCSATSQHPLNIPISIPISFNNHRASLSRSSGVRENLTDLLAITSTTSPTTKLYYSDNRTLQRTESTYGKVFFIIIFLILTLI